MDTQEGESGGAGKCYMPFAQPNSEDTTNAESHFHALRIAADFYKESSHEPPFDGDQKFQNQNGAKYQTPDAILPKTDQQRVLAKDADIIINKIKGLVQYAHEENDEYATLLLVYVALLGCDYVESLRNTNPDIMHAISKEWDMWPCILKARGDAPSAPKNLGEIHYNNINLKDTAYNDPESKITRAYATAIVNTLTKNRNLYRGVGGDIDSFVSFVSSTCDLVLEVPPWLPKCVELPDLSKDTIELWWRVGKEMFVTECPAFHESEDWSFQRGRAANRGLKTTDGYVRSQVLNDIRKALDRIVVD